MSPLKEPPPGTSSDTLPQLPAPVLRAVEYFQRHDTWLVFVLALAAILALHGDAIQEIPAWDCAAGMFPAAITLEQTNFNLPSLLKQPPYLLGGPNCHSLSLVTWITALVIRITGSGPATLPVLHLLHFLLGAIGLTSLYRYARPLLGSGLSLAAIATLLLFPVFGVQLRTMYLELPISAVTIFALLAWSSNRPIQAGLWAATACLIKETGIITAGTLLVAALLESRPWASRLARAGMAFGPALAVFAITVPLTVAENPYFEAREVSLPKFLGYLRTSFLHDPILAPDMVLLCMTLLLARLLQIRTVWAGLKAGTSELIEAPSAAPVALRRDLCWLLLALFMAFFMISPLMGRPLAVLIRYYVQILPFVVIGLAELFRRLTSRRGALVLLAVLACLFWVNRAGVWYRGRVGNNIARVERAGNYVDLLAVQLQGVRGLEQLPSDVPVFYALQEHFFVRYPLLGYASRAPEQGHCIHIEEPYRRGKLADFPHHFYVLFDCPEVGGELIVELIKQREQAKETWDLKILADFQQGRFKTNLLEFRRKK